MVHKKENLVETPKANVTLNISSENIPLEVNNGKDQVQGQQVPLKAAEIASQVKTSEEYQETCRVLCKDQLQTFNCANRLSDTSKGEVIVLEPPTKRPKTELKFYGEFEADKTINKQSLLNDVSLNFEVAGTGEVEVDSQQVSNVQIVDNSKDNIGEVHQNAAVSFDKKVFALKILKLDKNTKIQPVYSYGKEADEDSCEIVSGSKAHDNFAVGSARMPMNLPTPQPDVSATTRSMEDPSTVCVPKCETFPARSKYPHSLK
ncbi:Protein of unknown function [Cotesia congregata]|uniref:Uncharacterized protein n=1 Tax=Cotesia congregata TaxID=51543 RepID=A0A8J2HJL3_COTCN|nr:Protein of unknown function [Cotesia congregata]